MAPTAVSHNRTIFLDTSNRPIILVQGPDSPWALDLNTLVTIVLGVICIALQASQIYYEQRARKARRAESLGKNIENGGEPLLAHRQEVPFTSWRPPYSRDELDEDKSPEAARGQHASPIPDRRRASRQGFCRGGGVQLGDTGYLPPGYVYRRMPWQSTDWESGSDPRNTETGPALERRYSQRHRPGFI